MAEPIESKTATAQQPFKIPKIGLGTFKAGGDELSQAVSEALKMGYRHIDTASIYKNEAAVAEGIRLSGVPREEIFITSKLSPYEMRNAEKAYQACIKSLDRLNTSYLDLYLIHWPGVASKKYDSPFNAKARKFCWETLEKLHKEGKIRQLGVSNYEPRHVEELMAFATVQPVINQVEYHPFNKQEELRSVCEEHGIEIEAYASLGGGGNTALLEHDVIITIAKKYSVTPAQVLLRWALQNGVAAIIPKTTSVQRLKENLRAAEGLLDSDDDVDGKEEKEQEVLFHLTEQDMAQIGGLEDEVLAQMQKELESKEQGKASDLNQPRKLRSKHFCWDPVQIQ